MLVIAGHNLAAAHAWVMILRRGPRHFAWLGWRSAVLLICMALPPPAAAALEVKEVASSTHVTSMPRGPPLVCYSAGSL